MQLWQNIPIALVLLPLGFSSLTAAIKPKYARALFMAINGICVILTLALMINLGVDGELTVKMGEIGAPFGNELYVSGVECVILIMFDAVMLLSMMAGLKNIPGDIHENRRSLFFTVSQLLLAAINAIALTNDIFTGYVFLEITTIAAAALIFVRSRDGSLFAAMRYMIMNLLGSGLFLFGISMLYSVTGHLLFPQLRQASAEILKEGTYVQPLTVSMLLMGMGLAIKSALYPFHTWLPNAYSGATPAASSFLSSLVSKAYIFLLIKIIMRGTGLEAFAGCGAEDVLLIYAACAIILGSWDAIKEHNIRRMISYSSVAQIGYIFLAVALGNEAGMKAAVFQILAHSAAKAMLFPAVDRLSEVSAGNEDFRSLRGSGYRAPLSGIAFVIGAFSITGLPFLGGFSAKIYIAEAACSAGAWRMWLALFALAISTVLNVTYFLRTVVTIYRKSRDFDPKPEKPNGYAHGIAIAGFIAANLFLGTCAYTVMNYIDSGMKLWK